MKIPGYIFIPFLLLLGPAMAAVLPTAWKSTGAIAKAIALNATLTDTPSAGPQSHNIYPVPAIAAVLPRAWNSTFVAITRRITPNGPHGRIIYPIPGTRPVAIEMKAGEPRMLNMTEAAKRAETNGTEILKRAETNGTEIVKRAQTNSTRLVMLELERII
ncbi:hypothetical protein PVAG01_00295 [Phlyctema vagabunda]|uniref:Uncharacterized protein n=1 Tax=Phlyctema vagabunda TaxID=108571 RepID=A0ABR4PV95_9HELO